MEIILNTTVLSLIHAYKIKCVNNGSIIEFFKLNPAKYLDATPLDGITEELAEDVEKSLSQKLKAQINKNRLPRSWKWNLELLCFYSKILHADWVEYISELVMKGFTEAGIKPRSINVSKINSTALLIQYYN